jgi:transcriptional regulator with XRE-family HTH domain
MNKEQNIGGETNDGRPAGTADITAAEQLGRLLRSARRECGKGKWTLAWVAGKVGRSRVWLNRLELGYAKDGSIPLPTDGDLAGLAQLLQLDLAQLLQLRDDARAELEQAGLRRARPQSRIPVGRRAQAEVFRGDENVYRAAGELLARQSSEARLKVTHVVTRHPDPDGLRPYQRKYVSALADFLSTNRQTVTLDRVVHAQSAESLAMAKGKTAALAAGRSPTEIRNIDTRFCFANPVLLDVLIGEREALIAIPDHRGHPTLTAAILISDVSFVEALKTWFHDIVWKSPGVPVDYATAEETFAMIEGRLADAYD